MNSSLSDWQDLGATPPAELAGAGARPPRVRGEGECRHCGAPLAAGARTEPGFCCAGCAYVFRLIGEQGLDGFYRIKDATIPAADPVVFAPREVAWLQAAQEQAERTCGANPPEVTLGVQGISCAACVWLIERVFRRLPGAREIEVRAEAGQLRATWNPGEFSLGELGSRLQGFGYILGAADAPAAATEEAGLTRRIGLCAAFALNVMLFTLPGYFGMAHSFAYAPLFGVISMALATLSVLVGGAYFLERAAGAVRVGALHIDLPISLGIVGAYVGSMYGWFTAQERFIYFDFVSAFITLMLAGRWAQVAAVNRNRRRLLAGSPLAPRVTVERGGARAEIPIEQLAAQDRFWVGAGRWVPVDASLDSEAALVSTASITGEAEPRPVPAGALVPAGAVNVGLAEIRLRAAQSWSDSLLRQLLQPASLASGRPAFIDRILRGYVVGILGIAAGAGAGWWLATHDPVRTWAVVTAVMVVSCPCALGLAFPVVEEIATVALRRSGVFVREAGLWAKVHGVRKIIFDKTGTLTTETPTLENPGEIVRLSDVERAALFVLVRDNLHPASRCLAAHLLATRAADGATSIDAVVRETIGQGIAAEIDGEVWRLGRAGWSKGAGSFAAPAAEAENGHDTEFSRGETVLARFRFRDTLRADARRELARLGASGREVYLLSGDRQSKVAAIAEQLGVPRERAHGEATPRGKAAWVKALDDGDTLMLGDGANDSLAFDAALVRGTPAVHRGVLAGKADFYYLGQGLAGITRLFEVDGFRRRTQAWLLVFSVAYNLVAVGLAVAGRMNPLLAAVFMPVSSLVTLTMAVVGMRRVGVREAAVDR